MRVAIVGSRDFPFLDWVDEFVGLLPKHTTIASGGASGPDSTAEEAALKHGLPTPAIFLADWKKYGWKAGFNRNKDIIEFGQITVAFWNGESNGTADSIGRSWRLKKPTYVINSMDEKPDFSAIIKDILEKLNA